MPIQLPTEKTQPKQSITELTTLLYGAPKIGKSTFCSQAEDPLFLATEAGLNNLAVYQLPIASWPEFCEACQTIAAGDHQFKTIVIDTVDNLYKYCVAHTLAKHNLQHESDLPFGKGYAFVNGTFERVLTALSLLPYGLIMTSHAQEKEVKTPTGSENRVSPTLPGSARKIVLGMADLILYAEAQEVRDENGAIIGYNRVVHTKPTTIYEAGDRTGKLPETLPLEYAAFRAAVNQGFAIVDPTTEEAVTVGADPVVASTVASRGNGRERRTA